MEKISELIGRNNGVVSPNGKLVAIINSNNRQLSDLYLKNISETGEGTRITVSGSSNYHEINLIKPEVVSFQHKDGKPVWAGLYKPAKQHPNRPALLHIHGGGYRQFSHEGWSVYGYAMHLSKINYFVQQGYTILDLDYRGSSGFGRDYRTDIYRSMGIKDVESGLAGIDYLIKEHNINPEKIGVYGIS